MKKEILLNALFCFSLMVPLSIGAQVLDALPRHGYWGASFLPPTEIKAGATVRRIVPGGFGEKTGLAVGDVILSVNGIAINSNRTYQQVFRSTQIVKGGSSVNLEVLRQGNSLIKTGVLPAVPLESFPGIVTEYRSVRSSYGYKVQVIINRPENAKGKIPGIFLVRWMSCDPIEKPVSPKH